MTVNPGKQRGRVKDTKPPNTDQETHEDPLNILKAHLDKFNSEKKFEWISEALEILVQIGIHRTTLQTGYLLTDNNEELSFIYSGNELLQNDQRVYYHSLPDGSIQTVIVGIEGD